MLLLIIFEGAASCTGITSGFALQLTVSDATKSDSFCLDRVETFLSLATLTSVIFNIN